MIASLFSIVVLATSIAASPTPVAQDNEVTIDKRTFGLFCNSGWFSWNDACYKSSSNTVQPSSISISCPTGWTWEASNHQCKPKTITAASSISRECTSSGHSWLSDYVFCARKNFAGSTSSSCDSSYQWYWAFGSLCCAKGNYGNEGSIPSGKSCPSNYYWSTTWGCIPNSSQYGGSTSCPSGTYWDAATYSCRYTTPTTTNPSKCSSSAFFWNFANLCIDSGHDTSSRCPDSSKSCPNNYSWSTKYHHCIPDTVNDCDKPKPCYNPRHSWWGQGKYCKPPTPSGHYKKRQVEWVVEN